MIFRLCWLLLAVFLASCSGGSDSEEQTTASTFETASPEPFTPVQPGSAVFTYGPNDWVDRFAVSEVPSSKAQTISLKGATIPFTATAGHLIASMEAAIFYTAYTRDDQPHESRPVTFVFNGGPGGASAALDLEFLGPKSVDPSSMGTDLRFTDNPNTLLDRTDLVFVDPVGTGYSTAVKPNRNRNYWGVDSDAEILADFITRYINVNNRQSSPKYIYGVSYGGFRAPIIGRLLLETGTSKYAIDASYKPAKILSGLILNSPILDYKTDCYQFYAACGGALPTYAMVADFHKRSTERKGEIASFVSGVQGSANQFNYLYNTVFSGVSQKEPDRSGWETFLKTPEAPAFLDRLFLLTGIGKTYQLGDNRNNNTWIDNPNMDAIRFTKEFNPGSQLELGDGRFFRKRLRHPIWRAA
jgi:pimeloyl-ACP methyl ester carboxylesterase